MFGQFLVRALDLRKQTEDIKKKLSILVMHLYIFSLIYILYDNGSINIDLLTENIKLFFRKYWL